MPRANRHHIPGCIWHITHRCHKQKFLLGFEKDKQRWRHWLYEAKRRYGLCVLNYVVTSNHIHLLVVDTEEVLPGRVGPGYQAKLTMKNIEKWPVFSLKRFFFL